MTTSNVTDLSRVREFHAPAGRTQPPSAAATAPKPVRKAVFPVAGFGTRSLPATKAIPKELLTVVDKPVIQYSVEEAREAGIEEFIFVTSRNKAAIQDHFGPNRELYDLLCNKKKGVELDLARGADLPPGSYTFVTQPEPLGLGHAVWCARKLIGDEPFAVLLPDEIFLSELPVLGQMIDAYCRLGGSIMAVAEVPREQTRRYGILDLSHDDGRVAVARGLVEKPDPDKAPSNLSIVGRYILSPRVFEPLDRHERGSGGEIQLTDAVASLVGHEPVHGVRFAGRRFDCGDKAGYVAANVAFALERRDLRDKVLAELGRNPDAVAA